MSATAQLARLRQLEVPAISTRDVAAVLGLSLSGASHSLRRLSAEGLVRRARSGLWLLDTKTDPMRLLEYITAPWPSYVSLHSALHAHGVIEQIPSIIYAVTLGREGRVTAAGTTFSLHHVAPEFFGGFEVQPSGIKLATPEKALIDVFYFSSTRTRLFAALPELTLPRSFSKKRAREWISRIEAPRLRVIATRRFEELIRS